MKHVRILLAIAIAISALMQLAYAADIIVPARMLMRASSIDADTQSNSYSNGSGETAKGNVGYNVSAYFRNFQTFDVSNVWTQLSSALQVTLTLDANWLNNQAASPDWKSILLGTFDSYEGLNDDYYRDKFSYYPGQTHADEGGWLAPAFVVVYTTGDLTAQVIYVTAIVKAYATNEYTQSDEKYLWFRLESFIPEVLGTTNYLAGMNLTASNEFYTAQYLTITPIPEPALVFGAFACLSALAFARRKR